MGQRLNLEIRRRDTDKVIANAYYHWSAYTESASYLTELAYTFLSLNKHLIKDERLLAIRALECTGAGLPEYEDEIGDYTKIKNMSKYRSLHFEKCKDRNEGIISVFPDSIKSTQDWAEGTSIIYIDDMSISFDVLNYYEDVNDIKEWDEDFDENAVPIYNYDLDCLSLGELKDVVAAVRHGTWIHNGDWYIQEIS